MPPTLSHGASHLRSVITITGSLFAMAEYRKTPVLRQSVVAYKVAFKGVPGW